MKKAKAKRKAADDAARETAAKKINECLQQMRANASKVAIIAPSPEMVSILQVLNMKNKLNRQELDRAAQSMNGNSLALSALNDLADKHFFVGSPEGQSHPNYMVYSTDLSGEATDNYINSVAKYCNDILRSAAKKSALDGATFNYKAHGIKFDEDELPQRGELVSERSFYLNVVSENQIDSLMKAVNG